MCFPLASVCFGESTFQFDRRSIRCDAAKAQSPSFMQFNLEAKVQTTFIRTGINKKACLVESISPLPSYEVRVTTVSESSSGKVKSKTPPPSLAPLAQAVAAAIALRLAV